MEYENPSSFEDLLKEAASLDEKGNPAATIAMSFHDGTGEDARESQVNVTNAFVRFVGHSDMIEIDVRFKNKKDEVLLRLLNLLEKRDDALQKMLSDGELLAEDALYPGAFLDLVVLPKKYQGQWGLYTTDPLLYAISIDPRNNMCTIKFIFEDENCQVVYDDGVDVKQIRREIEAEEAMRIKAENERKDKKYEYEGFRYEED